MRALQKPFLLLLLLPTLGLSACGGNASQSDQGSKEDAETAFYYRHVGSNFSIEVPDEWETIDEFSGKYPEEIQIAFKSNLKSADYTPNVAIFEENNPDHLTNADFSQNKLKEHKNSLLDYRLLSQEEVTLGVGNNESTTFLNTFQGKNTYSGPTLTFQQLYLTKGGKAWIVTASYEGTQDAFEVGLVEHMLKSFTLK